MVTCPTTETPGSTHYADTCYQVLPPKTLPNGEVVPSGCFDVLNPCNVIALVCCTNPLKILWAVITMVFYTPIWVVLVLFGTFKCCFDCCGLLFDPLTYHTPKEEPTAATAAGGGATVNPLASSAPEGAPATPTADSTSKDGNVAGDASTNV